MYTPKTMRDPIFEFAKDKDISELRAYRSKRGDL
jgi:hypothetical protein